MLIPCLLSILAKTWGRKQASLEGCSAINTINTCQFLGPSISIPACLRVRLAVCEEWGMSCWRVTERGSVLPVYLLYPMHYWPLVLLKEQTRNWLLFALEKLHLVLVRLFSQIAALQRNWTDIREQMSCAKLIRIALSESKQHGTRSGVNILGLVTDLV